MKQVVPLLLGLLSIICSAQQSQRLVVIDGSLTEIVYALGAGKAVVAIDDTSIYPEEARQLPSVGYMRALSSEGILAMKPDQVLLTESAGPETVVRQLKTSGVGLNVIHNEATLNGVRKKIREVAGVLDKPVQAEAVLAAFNQKTRHFKAMLNTNKQAVTGKKALVFLGMQSNRYMAAGEQTKAQAILDMLSLTNGVTHKGYKPLSSEAILALNPDIIIIATHGQTDLEAFTRTLKMTNAARNQRIIQIDSDELLSFGPRLPDALMRITTAITKPVKPVS